MERLPLNPAELIESCKSFSEALREDAEERHARHHAAFLEHCTPVSFQAPGVRTVQPSPYPVRVRPSTSAPGQLPEAHTLAGAVEGWATRLGTGVQPAASMQLTEATQGQLQGFQAPQLQLQPQLSVEQQALLQAAAEVMKKPGQEAVSEDDSRPVSSSEGDEEELEFQAALALVPSWTSQLTGRGLVVGLLLGAVFCLVTHRLNLGPGFIPSLNIAAGLLAFCFLKAWHIASRALGLPSVAFGAQECNVVQTFITACSSVAFTGGFAHYLTAMDHKSYELLGGADAPGNRIQDVYEPTLRRVIPYLLSTSMIGVFMLVALRRTMIIDYNLTFPSGQATGLMIDSFFTKSGAKMVGSQLAQMGRFFCFSFGWDLLQWLVSSTDCDFCSEATCGLDAIPIFGSLAKSWSFYLSPSLNIIGAGMICPHEVNLSMLFGAVMTSALLWPYIASKEGDWYAAGQDEHAFGGLFGYKVFLTIAMLMGDGVYNVVKVLGASARAYFSLVMAQRASKRCRLKGCSMMGGAAGGCGLRKLCKLRKQAAQALCACGTANCDCAAQARAAWFPSDAAAPASESNIDGDLHQPLLGEPGSVTDADLLLAGRPAGKEDEAVSSPSASSIDSGVMGVMGQADAQDVTAATRESPLEHRVRTHVFLTDTIPWWVSLAGYLFFMVVGVNVIPHVYPAVKWYYVLMGFLVGPIMALPVVFGQGLTDWDVSSMICKLAIFAFAGWAGLESGGVVAGLAMAGVILGATSTSATLMQDFRTGYIVKCAPRAMFVAQLAGAAAGVVLAPLTFALFWATGKVGDPSGPYPTPYSAIYRAMAIFGTQGVTVLPKNCAMMMLVFFLSAIVINLARDVLPRRYARWLPIPMAMAIPFVLGAYIAIDMTIGSIILAIWEWRNPQSAEVLAPAVASGLIVGDGVFSVPLSIMGMLNINAPFCVAFGSLGTARSR